jgi:Reverse transcriptase (RNA-dependent DNA polymerase)
LSYRHIDKFNIIIHKNNEYSRSKKCCPIHCHSQAREILEALSLEDILHKNLLPAEFIFNINDESYPEEAPRNYKSMMKLRELSWLNAHESELHNFLCQKAWTVLPRSSLPKEKWTLKTRFVYRINSDGTKKARCEIKGYEQIPGIDFHDSFSSLATDTTIRTLHSASLQPNLGNRNDCAFLNAEVDQDIFIEIPEGLCEYSQKKEVLEIPL